MTQAEFNQMLSTSVAQGIVGGIYPSQFDGEEIDGAIKRFSNKNLLVNWYLIGGGSQQGTGQFPINQRGATTSTTTTSSKRYNIMDRWWSYFKGTFTLIPEGFHMTAGSSIEQNLSEWINIPGLPFTFSVLYMQNGVTKLNYATKPFGNDNIVSYIHKDPFVDIRYSNGYGGPYVEVRQPPTDITVLAMKFEPGTQQTLAHQDASGNWVLNDPPPNMALELAKCQRYCIPGKMSGFPIFMNPNTISFYFPTCETMRANPTLVGNIGVYTGTDSPHSGFTLRSAEARATGVLCIMDKTAHGLSKADEPTAYIDKNSVLSADL